MTPGATIKCNAVMSNGKPFTFDLPVDQLARLVAPPTFNCEEAAEYLGISIETLRKLNLPKNQLKRYPKEVLDNFLTTPTNS